MAKTPAQRKSLRKLKEEVVEASSLGDFGEQLKALSETFIKEAKGIAEKQGIDLDVVVRFGVTNKFTQGA